VIATLVLTILSVVMNYWLFRSLPYDHPQRPRWRSLTVSFVGYTNSKATIEVKNRWGQTVSLEPYVDIDLTDHEHRLLYSAGGYHRVPSTTNLDLVAGATVKLTFPAPTNCHKWRAVVSGVGERDLRWDKALRSSWYYWNGPRWIFRHNLVHAGYAQTEWIEQ
jgi:hypothetical protein